MNVYSVVKSPYYLTEEEWYNMPNEGIEDFLKKLIQRVRKTFPHNGDKNHMEMLYEASLQIANYPQMKVKSLVQVFDAPLFPPKYLVTISVQSCRTETMILVTV